MATFTINIPDDQLETLRTAAAGQGQAESEYVTAKLMEGISRDLKKAEERRMKDWNLLYGPGRPAAQVHAELRARHNLPDYSHLTPEERIRQTDEIISQMTPEQQAEAERLGIL